MSDTVGVAGEVIAEHLAVTRSVGCTDVIVAPSPFLASHITAWRVKEIDDTAVPHRVCTSKGEYTL